jgi:hypothetical protein
MAAGTAMLRGTGRKDGQDKPVSNIVDEEPADCSDDTTVLQRNDQCIYRFKPTIFSKRGSLPRCNHSHFQLKDGEKTLENVAGERFDTFGLFGIGNQSDDQTSQNQQYAAVTAPESLILILRFRIKEVYRDTSVSTVISKKKGINNFCRKMAVRQLLYAFEANRE